MSPCPFIAYLAKLDSFYRLGGSFSVHELIKMMTKFEFQKRSRGDRRLTFLRQYRRQNLSRRKYRLGTLAGDDGEITVNDLSK